MSRPEYYKTVIARALERNVHKGWNSMEFAELILGALDLADDILGGESTKPANILIKTPAVKEIDLSRGILIGKPNHQINAEIVGEEAPPAALVRNPEGVVAGETDEEIESKKAQLQAWALNNLPRSMTLKLPGFEKDIQLNQYIRPSPPKMNFVRVFYTQFPEEEDGPQLQLSTADTSLDPEAIKREILAQAASRYRAQKQKIEARIPPPNPAPDLDAAFRNTKYDASQDVVSPEDRELWNRSAGRNVI